MNPFFRFRSPQSHQHEAATLIALVCFATLACGCAVESPEVAGGDHDAASDAQSHPGDASGDASQPIDAGGGLDAAADAGSAGVRVVVLSRDGHVASFDLDAPWTVRASESLGAEVASARCQAGRCAVAHPSPSDSVVVVDAHDLHVERTFSLLPDADPRDAAWMDDLTLLITQYGSSDLILADVVTGLMTPLTLVALADDDGLPEAGRVAHCGHTAYVQIARTDHASGSASPLGAALAVIDLDRVGVARVVDVDPLNAGVQGIPLAARAEFDMPVDCVAQRLYVSEPKPLFSGGGAYEVVDLSTMSAADFPYAFAQIGGFEVVSEASGLVWQITHTDFGPGASSHLTLAGGTVSDTHNSFSGQHVDELALDRESDQLFFPDPCVVTPSNTACEPGVHVFDAHSGARTATSPVALAFEPIEIAVAR